MKLIKPRTFVIFALVGLAGAVLLNTSQSVQHAEEKLEALERSVGREEEKIRMLRAEWESLNSPERLERLANEFLDLVPPAPEQMAMPAAAFPDVVLPVEGMEESAPVLQPVSLGGSAPAPKPKQKPIRAVAPKKPLPPSKEKAFGDLLNELGGGQ